MLAEVDYFYALPTSFQSLFPKRKKLKSATEPTTAAPALHLVPLHPVPDPLHPIPVPVPVPIPRDAAHPVPVPVPVPVPRDALHPVPVPVPVPVPRDPLHPVPLPVPVPLNALHPIPNDAPRPVPVHPGQGDFPDDFKFASHPDLFVPDSGWRNHPNLGALQDVSSSAEEGVLSASKERVWRGQSSRRVSE